MPKSRSGSHGPCLRRLDDVLVRRRPMSAVPQDGRLGGGLVFFILFTTMWYFWAIGEVSRPPNRRTKKGLIGSRLRRAPPREKAHSLARLSGERPPSPNMTVRPRAGDCVVRALASLRLARLTSPAPSHNA